MKGKPIFNQGYLQRIASKPQFMVRNKISLSKSRKGSKSSLNIEGLDKNIGVEVQNCLEIVQKCIRNQSVLGKEEMHRLVGLLTSFKGKYSVSNSGCFQDVQESSSMVLKQSDVKCRSRKRLQTLQDRSQNVHQEGIISDMIKNKTPKLKLNKENCNRNPVVLEMKIQRLTHRLEEKEKMEDGVQGQVRRLRREIELLSQQKKEVQGKMHQIANENKELAAKASKMLLEKIESESSLKQKMVQLQHKIQEKSQHANLLQERLRDRQYEIVALFQMQKR